MSVLVPPAHRSYAVERATVPTLPSIEVIGLSSERVDTGPMVVHELSIECTVSHATEDGADELLDAASSGPYSQRIGCCGASELPRIALADGEGCLVRACGATRWSISAASGASSVIRGASISLRVQVSE